MGEKEREGTVEHARENSASLDKTSWQRKRERGREREGGEREDDREGKEKEQEQAAGLINKSIISLYFAILLPAISHDAA